MGLLDKHARLIFYVVWLVSIVLMVVDLIILTDYNIFWYIMTNGILIFRLLGLWVAPWFIHFISFIALVILCIAIKVGTAGPMLIVYLLPIIIYFLISICMVFWKTGKTCAQRACRIGLHALLGIILAICYFFVVAFILQMSWICCVLELIYLLLFLFMILTPHFLTKRQAVMLAQREAQRKRFPQSRSRSFSKDRASMASQGAKSRGRSSCRCCSVDRGQQRSMSQSAQSHGPSHARSARSGSETRSRKY